MSTLLRKAIKHYGAGNVAVAGDAAAASRHRNPVLLFHSRHHHHHHHHPHHPPPPFSPATEPVATEPTGPPSPTAMNSTLVAGDSAGCNIALGAIRLALAEGCLCAVLPAAPVVGDG